MIEVMPVSLGTNQGHTLSAREASPSGVITDPDRCVSALLRPDPPRAERNSLLGKDIVVAVSVIEACIARVEGALNDGSWFRRKDFADADLSLMPDLVQMANERKPGLGLVYLAAPDTLGELIKRGVERAGGTRYIVNVGPVGIHFAVIDCRVLEGHTSVILFEPADKIGLPQRLMAQGCEQSVQAACSPATCHFLHAEMDIQRSRSECGIFSLALAKKLHKEHEALTALHQMNVSGGFRDNRYISPAEVDRYLPPSFYKHTQGQARIADYLTINPDAGQTRINKKQQTLLERFKGCVEEVDGKAISKSAHNKRLVELKLFERHLQQPSHASRSESPALVEVAR